ncbi:hypothetical protein D3C71_1464480 [compost metagenome]
MQRRVDQPHQVRRDDDHHRLGPVGGQHGNAVLPLQAHRLQAAHHAMAALFKLAVAHARAVADERFAGCEGFEGRAVEVGEGGALVES